MHNFKNKNENVKDLIDLITEAQPLHDMLEKSGISKITEVNRIKKYQRKGDREGILLKVKKDNDPEAIRVLIDLKIGEPAVDQIIDATFGIGNDCDRRIILYAPGTNTNDLQNPAADELVTFSLIQYLQRYPLGFSLFQIDEKMLTFGLPEYLEPIDVSDDEKLSFGQLPSKERVLAHTFWTVYFNSFNEAFYKPWEAFDDEIMETNDWGHTIYIDCCFFGEIQLYWDNKGVRYVIKQEDDNHEYLKRVLDLKMPELKNRYGNDSMEFENMVGRLPRLKIKNSDKPLSWLTTASPAEISEFAKIIYDDAWELRWFIEETADRLFEDKVA
ncbi:MAG TPA: hypothetical protein DCY12_12260 [Candidatus Atribacteria bacterium]|nr:hypothetical protein [Candidatus Atribacteria bacterium]